MAAAWLPRTMLPPPTTTAISTPSDCTSASCLASEVTTVPSMPNPPSVPAKISPESLSKTRRKTGFTPPASPPEEGSPSVVLPHPEPGEAADDDVLLHAGGQLADDVADLLLAGLVPDVELLEQHPVLVGEDRLDLALDDLLADLLGLLQHLVGAGEDLALLVEEVGRHVLDRHPLGLQRRHVHGDVAGQLLELRGLGDEVGLAVQLEQHAHLRRQTAHLVQVGGNDPLGGGPHLALLDPGQAP